MDLRDIRRWFADLESVHERRVWMEDQLQEAIEIVQTFKRRIPPKRP